MAKDATSPTDVVEFLTDQHERIKSLFDKTLSSSGPQRKDAFLTLRRLLAVHETGEEEIVHPRAKRKLAAGSQVVRARLAEEHQAKVALAALECPSSRTGGAGRWVTAGLTRVEGST